MHVSFFPVYIDICEVDKIVLGNTCRYVIRNKYLIRS